MSNFEKLLTEIRKDSTGKSFEKFCKWFLENDPYWKTQVEQVWHFDDWPGRWHRDKGVDLIFKHKNGQNWAVQAKCYSEKYYIKKEDIDSFLSDSSRKIIHQRLLIGTTDKIGKNAIETMSGQDKPVRSFLLNEIKNSGLEYPSALRALYSKVSKKKISKNRPYQQNAVKQVLKEFKKHDRGKLIMACGTGKTLVTLWIKEKLKPQTTLVLLPSLNLLSQTLFEWTTHCKDTFEVLCICSDTTVGKQNRNEDMKVTDAYFDVTSDMPTISKFLKLKKPKVIFCTYQSSDLVGQAQKNEEIDLVICDEAHRCTGLAKSTFTKILDDENIKAKKRLFTTATPRIFPSTVKTAAFNENKEVYGMDNETIYGPEFFNYTFGQAIDEGWLTDYQVVIVGVDEPTVKKSIDQRELIALSDYQNEDAETLASKISIAKAIKNYEIKRMISFHNRVKEARNFSIDFQNTFKLINKKDRPTGIVWTDYISGQMTVKDRKLKLQQLKLLPNFDIGIISNARCLSEGVDVPALDGIGFVDPKGSQIDIIQSVGRALRKSESKNLGTIILPVYIKPGDNPEASINNSNFKPVWDVLKALSSHDKRLYDTLNDLRQNLRNNGKKISQILPKNIMIDLPKIFDLNFINSLQTILITNITQRWFFYLGILKEYVQKNKFICSRSHITDDGLKLGKWVDAQRVLYKRKKLSKERIAYLEEIPIWSWDVLESQWNYGLQSLKIFEEKNHSIPLRNYIEENGYALGSWCSTQRKKFKLKELNGTKIKLLEKIKSWNWDPRESQWKMGYKYFLKYGNRKNPINKLKKNNLFNLDNWISLQRTNFKNNKLSREKIILLESLEFWDWDPLHTQWEKGLEKLKEYVRINNDIPTLKFICDDGFKLGVWIDKQRQNYNIQKLSAQKIQLLNDIGPWSWTPIELKWEINYKALENYIFTHNIIPEKNYMTSDGLALGTWVDHQRNNYKKKKLSKVRINLLNKLPFWDWYPLDSKWYQEYNLLKSYIKKYNYLPTRSNIKYQKLSSWCTTQRLSYKKNKLSEERINLLEKMSIWTWDPLEEMWFKGYEFLKDYLNKNGNLPSRYYVNDDDFKLGDWISTQKQLYKKEKLLETRINLLEKLKPYWKW